MQIDLKTQLSGTFCACFNVTYSEIAMLIKNIKSIKSIEDLNKYIVVCKNCNLCCSDVKKIISYYNK